MRSIKVYVSKFIPALIAASLLLSAASALAHDSRPAYLELVETESVAITVRYAHRKQHASY